MDGFVSSGGADAYTLKDGLWPMTALTMGSAGEEIANIITQLNQKTVPLSRSGSRKQDKK